MSLDLFIITMRLIILMLLGIISQLALSKRKYALAFWTMAFWLTIFRLMVLRVLSVYPHQEDPNLEWLEMNVMKGWFSVLTDMLLVISGIPMFIWISETYQNWKKGVN